MHTLSLEINNTEDRVRKNSSPKINAGIDQQIVKNIETYSYSKKEEVKRRIIQLDKEWDIERVLEVNASTLALTGLVLSITMDKKWLALTGGVLAFLLQHGIQGWCPPLPILRQMGIRTRGEIDREKYALLELIR